MERRSQPRFEQVPLEHVPIVTGPRVLNVSRERSLALPRSAILKRAGFRVETALTADHAARLLHQQDYEAVVVCHSLSREQRAQVIGAARASSSAPWIVGLYYLDPAEASGTHVTVDTQDGAQAVLNAMRRVGKKAGRTARGQKAKR